MKRTTYIFIGIFFANILIAVGFGAYITSIMQEVNGLAYSFDSIQAHRSSMDISDVHTVSFSVRNDNGGYYHYETRGAVTIQSAKAETGGVIWYPVSESLKLEKKDSVLNVTFDIPFENQAIIDHSRGVASGNVISLKGLNFLIEANKKLKRISGDRAFEVAVNQVQLDRLSLNTSSVSMDSCSIRYLALDGNSQFIGRRSQIEEMYIDLDRAMNWKMDESEIECLYLTGSGKFNKDLSKLQCRRLVWEPKDENAVLNLNLDKRSQIVMN